ncbi:hypothetical protein PTW35_13765 [Photobacterium sp. DA100]|uniref:hypothetical protein n=1 Tax=Photobacterium sp. DA100 TaxID=3027472 RepID=UPI002478E711|nr:hypothetical protein [Photobacterium sp. DA100]WEM41675.1 hypothetical protein PTW35_13765 [Photobacterium sp. DA100]
MSIASYLMFGILGFLTMLVIQGLEAAVQIPGASSALTSWLAIYGTWLAIIAHGVYLWCKNPSHRH